MAGFNYLYTDIETARTKHPALLQPYQQLLTKVDHLIYIPPQAVIPDILHLETTNNLIIAAPHSQVTLYGKHGTTYLVAQNAARINYFATIQHHASLYLQQADHSSVQLHYLIKHTATLSLDQNFLGEYAQFDAEGIYLLQDKQTTNINLICNHQYSNCLSNILFKGLLDDQAVGVFTGRIIVAPHTHHNETHLTNKNILLSPSARCESAPQLEIYADDVKCTHGSSTGHFAAQTLFYLQSRGYTPTEARKLLIQGFIQEILIKFPQFLQDTL